MISPTNLCLFFLHPLRPGLYCARGSILLCSGVKESVILCATLMSCSPYPPQHHAWFTWDLIFAAKLQFFFFLRTATMSLTLSRHRNCLGCNPQTIKPLQMNPSSMDLLFFYPFHLRLHLCAFVWYLLWLILFQECNDSVVQLHLLLFQAFSWIHLFTPNFSISCTHSLAQDASSNIKFFQWTCGFFLSSPTFFITPWLIKLLLESLCIASILLAAKHTRSLSL